MVEQVSEEAGTSEGPSAGIQVKDDDGWDQGRSGEKWSDSDIFQR